MAQRSTREQTSGLSGASLEMLTGRRAFAGETIADTLAAVVFQEPPWTSLPSATSAHPASPARTLSAQRSQAPASRYRRRANRSGRRDRGARRSSTHRTRVSRLVAVHDRNWLYVSLVLIGAAAILWWRPAVSPSAPETRFRIRTAAAPTSIALSPDGATVVFAAEARGRGCG